jgi:hypothetical protein
VKRVLGIVFFGIGIALAVFAAALRFYVTPIATNIPYDLAPSTTIAEAKNGQYINTTNGAIESATLDSYTYVVPQPVTTRDKLTGDLAGTAVVWDVYSQIKASNGTVLEPSSQEIALDRKTGAVVAWDKAWVNSTGTQAKSSVTGYSYKLPFNAQQITYPYWDDTLGKTLDLTYAATEQVSGLTAYRYEQAKVDQKIPWDAKQLSLLRIVFGGGSGDIYYDVTRTIWVEPVTGQFLNVKQSGALEFRGGNGTKKTLLAGDFEYTDQTKADAANTIKKNHDELLLASLYLPAGTGGPGVILLALGIVLIVTSGKKMTAEAGAAPAADATATHATAMPDAISPPMATSSPTASS